MDLIDVKGLSAKFGKGLSEVKESVVGEIKMVARDIKCVDV